MKAISIVLILASLVVPVDAKPRRAAQLKRDRAEERREQKEREARERKREAIQRFLAPKDKNHDGSLSRDECWPPGTPTRSARSPTTSNSPSCGPRA